MSNVIGFYGADGKYGCFSNFYLLSFQFEGHKFYYSEHMIMWQKAMLFGDTTMAARILNVDLPLDAKRLGRKVTPYDDGVWEENRERLVVPGLYAKFEQNEDIRNILLSTGDHILAECSPRDKIWGIGLSINNMAVDNPNCWRGDNLQGTYLMKVRDQLREAGYTYEE